MTQLRRVAIIGGNRIPFARSNGPYATASNQAMLTAALEGLIERYNLHGLRMGEVAAGAVLKHSRDYDLTRECVLGSRLSPTTPAYDIQQACGTGLEATLLVANKIALGANRMWHCRWRRHCLGRADRGQRKPAQDPLAGQPRPKYRRQTENLPATASPPLDARLSKHRRAAHRPVDGRTL